MPSGEPNAKAVYEQDFPYRAADVACNPPHTHHTEIAESWHEIASSPSVSQIKSAIEQYKRIIARLESVSREHVLHIGCDCGRRISIKLQGEVIDRGEDSSEGSV